MKATKQLSLIAFAIIFFSSCVTTVRMSTTKTMDINSTGIIQTPVIADLYVKEVKVSGNARVMDRPLEEVKSAAVANALKNSNADVLVEPTFEVTQTGTDINVDVKGYPATYKNFRTPKQDDLSDINKFAQVTNSTQPVVTKSSSQVNPKKSGGSKTAGIILVGILLPLIAITGLVLR